MISGRLRIYIRMYKGKPRWLRRRLSKDDKRNDEWHRFEIDFDTMQIREIEIEDASRNDKRRM